MQAYAKDAEKRWNKKMYWWRLWNGAKSTRGGSFCAKQIHQGHLVVTVTMVHDGDACKSGRAIGLSTLYLLLKLSRPPRALPKMGLGILYRTDFPALIAGIAAIPAAGAALEVRLARVEAHKNSTYICWWVGFWALFLLPYRTEILRNAHYKQCSVDGRLGFRPWATH